MENNKMIIVKKVNVEHLMDALHELYHVGVEYVDIVGIRTEETDALTLRFAKEYMHEEFKDQYENISIIDDFPEQGDIRLSDEDLNQIS